MNKNVIGIVVALGLLGVAAFIFFRKPAEQRADPIKNILDVAPGAIQAGGNIVTTGQNTVGKVIRSSVDLATTPVRATLSAGKSIVKSLLDW